MFIYILLGSDSTTQVICFNSLSVVLTLTVMYDIIRYYKLSAWVTGCIKNNNKKIGQSFPNINNLLLSHF